jgi:hypothetical protein
MDARATEGIQRITQRMQGTRGRRQETTGRDTMINWMDARNNE